MSANVNIEARAPKDIEPEYAELWERAVEILEKHRKWTPAEPEAAPPADLNARHTVQTCVHPYALQRSGRCEGCGVYPLSRSLPDHHSPLRPAPEDLAESA